MSGGFANPRPGLALSAGDGLMSGTVVLSNSNNVSFGMQTSASSHVITMSISGSGIGAAIQSLSAGSTAVTNGQAVLSNSGILAFGINGQTVTASVSKVNYWFNGINPMAFRNVATSSASQNLYLFRENFFFPIDATRADFCGSMGILGANISLAAATYTLMLGAYTLSGSTASRASTASVTVAFTTGLTVSDLGQYGAHIGAAYRSIPLTWSITPGDYLLAFMVSMSMTSSSISFQFGGSGGYPTAMLAPGGGNPVAYFANGVYSAGTATLPGSIHVTDVVQSLTNASYRLYPALRIVGTF